MQGNTISSFLTTEQVFLVRKHLFSLRLTALLSYPDFNSHKYTKAIIGRETEKENIEAVTNTYLRLAAPSCFFSNEFHICAYSASFLRTSLRPRLRRCRFSTFWRIVMS